jgi:DNA-binding CsgD family transcriptional regulator
MKDSTADRIHSLWDELADFGAAQADAALDHLLAGLCGFVDAQNATWIGAVRMADIVPGDPARGWRPRVVRQLRPSPQVMAATKEQIKMLEQGSVDETTIRNVSLAGRFRVNRLADLVSPAWFDSAYYHVYYLGVGNADGIWAGIPINEDAECYFGVFRDGDRPRFTPEERDLVAYALRGLKWFHRRQMLGHGLTVANAPLTAAEREVLGGLLGGLSEKQIAAARRQSPHTTHEYVTSIYRKFGVGNRAALMALWLGRGGQ